MENSIKQQQEINVDNSLQVFGSKDNFENAQRMAQALAASSLIPKSYQGRDSVAVSNCMIALEMANRIRMSPLMVMQNLYIVHGNVGWSSKFLIAAINASGRFTPLRYEFRGEEGKDNWGCRAWAYDTTGEKLDGPWVDIIMAKKEGWYSKNGSKWQTIPELMLRYRAATFFSRTYCPEIGMGMQTAEELNDTGKPIDVDFTEVIRTELPSEEIKTTQDAKTELLKGNIDPVKYSEIVNKYLNTVDNCDDEPDYVESLIDNNAFGLKNKGDEFQFTKESGMV